VVRPREARGGMEWDGRHGRQREGGGGSGSAPGAFKFQHGFQHAMGVNAGNNTTRSTPTMVWPAGPSAVEKYSGHVARYPR